jgi:pilus assembly protein CpaC
MVIGVWTRLRQAARNASSPRMFVRWLVAITLLLAVPTRGTDDFFDNRNVVVGQPTIDLAVGDGRVLRFDGPVDFSVADPSIVDVRIADTGLAYVSAKKSGTTNLTAMSADHVRSSMQLRVTANATTAHGAAAIIDFRARKEPTKSVEKATLVGDSSVANETACGGRQEASTRIRFVEVPSSDLPALGFKWTALSDGRVGMSDANIDSLVETMRKKGSLTVLIESNLTAVDRQTATFHDGTPVAQPDGKTQAQYKKNVGVSLELTPFILANDRIGLHVSPTAVAHRGETTDGLELPLIQVSRTHATVAVASGQTFALAGLFQDLVQADGAPPVSDGPVLAKLFDSDRFRRHETELAILITPRLETPHCGLPPQSVTFARGPLRRGPGPILAKPATLFRPSCLGPHGCDERITVAYRPQLQRGQDPILAKRNTTLFRPSCRAHGCDDRATAGHRPLRRGHDSVLARRTTTLFRPSCRAPHGCDDRATAGPRPLRRGPGPIVARRTATLFRPSCDGPYDCDDVLPYRVGAR